MPYSWDEPTLLPELSVGVMGSGSYMQYNMQDLGGGERLYYYNPVYIVFTHTFSRYFVGFFFQERLLRLRFQMDNFLTLKPRYCNMFYFLDLIKMKL